MSVVCFGSVMFDVLLLMFVVFGYNAPFHCPLLVKSYSSIFV